MKVKDNLKSFKVSWVKAHQDSKQSINKLPLKAQLNVTADKDVNASRENLPLSLKQSTSPVVSPSLKAYIIINEYLITGKLLQWPCDKYSSLDIATHI
eukprot:10110450-Ditylum_brightwellii.AAC.1